jgi:hypothetical protein
VGAAIDRAKATMKGLRPPAEAATLHAELLRLLDLQAAVAHELAAAAAFGPRLSAALRAVRPASSRLAAELRRAPSGQADAEAYAHYRASLTRTLTRLGRLDPPTELKPTVAAQVTALTARLRLANRLVTAFARNDNAAVSAALNEFRLGTRTEAEHTYRAQLALVKAFNQRLNRISRLTDAIGRERQRLAHNPG